MIDFKLEDFMLQKIITFTIAIVLASVLFFSCKDNSTAPIETQQLTAYLVDASDNPVPDAYVQAFQGNSKISSDTTNDDGQFELANIPIDLTNIYLIIRASSFPETKTELNKVMKSNEFNSGKKFKILRSDNCKSSITITVQDSANGNPLANVWVKVSKEDQIYAKIKTNSEGKIIITNLCSGKYWYRVAPDGYKVVEGYFILGENDQQSITIKVSKIQQQNCCSQLHIKVIDNDSGQPINNAEVKLAKTGTDWYTKKYTNADGKVTFGEICDGKYWIRVAKDGYKVKEEDGFIFSECDTLEAIIKLIKNTPPPDSCYGAFYLTVLDNANGNPIAGADVKLTKEGWEGARKSTSDNGKVSFGQLAPGKYFVRIAKDGYQVIETYFILEKCDTIVWERKLTKSEQKDTCCAGKIIIYAKDESSKAMINGAVVKLWKGGQLIKSITITENQPAKFTDLCEGQYGISVNAENYNGKEMNISLGCNKTEEATLYLTKKQQDSCCNNKLIVYIKDDSTGQALKNAKVRIWKNGQQLTYKLTDENGKAVFEQLCKGSYGVDVIRESYQSIEFQFEVNCNDTKEITKTMKINQPCTTAGLKFLVKDYENGTPISGATVVIKANGQVIAQGTTNAEGYYIKENLAAPFVYSITISKDGYQTQTFEITVKECKLYGETVKLKK